MKYLCIYVIVFCLLTVPLPFIAANSVAAAEMPVVAVFIDGEIKELPVEDYALMVLSAYGSYAHGLEAKKALAVAARSCGAYFSAYGCKHIDYDACADGNCCIALGRLEDADEDMKTAVFETYGQVLTLESLPAMALFTVCASLGTRANVEFPYLTPVSESERCEEHKTEQSYTKEELLQLLPKNTESVENFAVYDDNGNLEFGVFGGRMIEGDDFLRLIGAVSPEIIITPSAECISIVCYGIGHCYGLNLCGANRMERQGFDFKKILEIYYPKLKMNKIF